MWKTKLRQVSQYIEQYNMSLNKGIQNGEYERVVACVQDKFGIEMPTELKEVYLTINGLEFNGCTLYGIDEFLLDESVSYGCDTLIDMNEVWRESSDLQYLYLGDESISWFVFDHTMNQYYVLDKPSGDIVETISTLDELLSSMFCTMLNETYKATTQDSK